MAATMESRRWWGDRLTSLPTKRNCIQLEIAIKMTTLEKPGKP